MLCLTKFQIAWPDSFVKSGDEPRSMNPGGRQERAVNRLFQRCDSFGRRNVLDQAHFVVFLTGLEIFATVVENARVTSLVNNLTPGFHIVTRLMTSHD